ncbi:wiskott-Aldrich syndrome protein homolog [Panicum hallii]|uniref:wiskott-Aldrich syndrome protein homolog n=1 Tax=Panicum hallii TaxID=206008 RepID=UPI000DF4E4FB|nr:wiskott-Aldrich syndrome protein homolog [Panicum hallii]
MGAKLVALTAGTAALVYVALSGRLSSTSGDAAGAALRRQWRPGEEDEANKGGGEEAGAGAADLEGGRGGDARTAGFASTGSSSSMGNPARARGAPPSPSPAATPRFPSPAATPPPPSTPPPASGSRLATDM